MKKPGRDDTMLIEASDLRPGPAAEVEQREDVRQALDTIAGLPERQRTALLAVAFDGRSHADVGAELGLKEPAVRQLVSRARDQSPRRRDGHHPLARRRVARGRRRRAGRRHGSARRRDRRWRRRRNRVRGRRSEGGRPRRRRRRRRRERAADGRGRAQPPRAPIGRHRIGFHRFDPARSPRVPRHPGRVARRRPRVDRPCRRRRRRRRHDRRRSCPQALGRPRNVRRLEPQGAGDDAGDDLDPRRRPARPGTRAPQRPSRLRRPSRHPAATATPRPATTSAAGPRPRPRHRPSAAATAIAAHRARPVTGAELTPRRAAMPPPSGPAAAIRDARPRPAIARAGARTAWSTARPPRRRPAPGRIPARARARARARRPAPAAIVVHHSGLRWNAELRRSDGSQHESGSHSLIHPQRDRHVRGPLLS